MANPKVLLVEDETSIRELIELHLKREGCQVNVAMTGEEALQMFSKSEFDVLVLDWMLPGLSGLEIARSVRRSGSTVPILMVTARSQTSDIVAGLEAGADDYVTKPFDLGVLMARVRALLRRGSKSISSTKVKFGNLEIDLEAHEVSCGSTLIDLTPSEFRLLQALVENKGRVLTRERLIDFVQGEGVNVVGRSIDTHVFGLRKKLLDCSDFIETIRGVGYRIKPDV